MMVHGDAGGKSDVRMSRDKESISLLNSIFRSIRRSEDAFDPANSKNLYALCDLGMPIIKRFAPDQGELQDSSVSVALPPVLYKPLEKKEGNGSLVGEGKTWLADEVILAHFESLKLEANGVVQLAIIEDDIMKDSETEGSELPLGKLMKRLKAKATKSKKEAKNKPAQAGVANENDFDILKMLNEIKSGNQGATSKYESSNGHGYALKSRKSDLELQESKNLFSESTDTPVPKRRRTSAEAQKFPGAVGSKGSKRLTTVNQVNVKVDFDIMNEEPQTSSEDQHTQEKAAEPIESELLSSHTRKKSSSSSKHKLSEGDPGIELTNSPKAKKLKKVSNTDSTHSISSSKLGSLKKQNSKSITGLAKCTTKDKGSSAEHLIGCRIKVWWPMDKQYYEGIVKSFDTEKNKHVILYDDGDVEVLRLERERWELVGNTLKTKRAPTLKGFSPRGSSGQSRRPGGGPKQDKKLVEKSPSSQVRKKRTPWTSPKERSKIMLKSEYIEESSESRDVACPEFKIKSSIDDSGSEKRPTRRISKSSATKVLSDKDHKQEEDVENVLSDVEEPKKTQKDSEDTESDDFGGSPHDSRGSDDEAVSSSDKQQTNESKEESGEEVDEADNIDNPGTSLDKLDKKTSASDSVDTELSDDEPLSMWKLRSGKN